MNAVRKEKVQVIASEPDPVLGYRKFKFGNFTFERDAYFVHIGWPKGKHTIEVDRFLRAMVRDIGWGFFYGWIFFDDVFGTQNHYGTVDIFAGTYSKGHRDTGSIILETFNTDDVREAFETISVTGSTKATIRCVRRWKPVRRWAPRPRKPRVR